MGDIEEDYTEERLADYDRVAIDHDDVLVMGFVTLVRQLRNELAAEREWRARVVPLLHNCIAETDSWFQETLLRRLDEQVNAAKLLPSVTPAPPDTRTKGEKT